MVCISGLGVLRPVGVLSPVEAAWAQFCARPRCNEHRNVMARVHANLNAPCAAGVRGATACAQGPCHQRNCNKRVCD
eukprot:5937768-Alexandrium_andersonii.AAC.1